MKNYLKGKEGFCYAEVILAIVLMGFMITPLMKVVMTNTRFSQAAKKTYEASYHMQNMMKEIKINLTHYLHDEEEKHLVKGSNEHIGDLRQIFITQDSLEQLEARYELEHYIYEVGIWPVTRENKGNFMPGMDYSQMMKWTTWSHKGDYEYQIPNLIEEGKLIFGPRTASSQSYNLFEPSHQEANGYLIIALAIREIELGEKKAGKVISQIVDIYSP